jgi:TRAP-type C4-dicarboxylate transport system permease small subunit
VRLKTLNDLLCAVLRVCCLVLVVSFSCCVFFQVLARNYIKISVPWTDEMALVLFVWSVFLGAAVGLRERSHFLVDILPKSMLRANSGLDLFASFMVLFIVVILLIGGITFTRMGLRRNFNSIVIKQAWLFVSMPVSAFCMILFSIENIITDIGKVKSAARKGKSA